MRQKKDGSLMDSLPPTRGEALPADFREKAKSNLREITEAFVIALILALVIRTFVIQAFKIPSGSMEDTLLIGDYLLVNKFIYGVTIPFTDIHILKFNSPRFNDVVVFKYPKDKKKDYIKRVIGVPGDEIKIVGKTLYVNGVPKDTSFAKWSAAPGENRSDFGPIIVPPDSIFVMGDNRDNSSDSRVWGFVPMKYIKGKALIIYFSWDGTRPQIWHKIRWVRIGKTIP